MSISQAVREFVHATPSWRCVQRTTLLLSGIVAATIALVSGVVVVYGMTRGTEIYPGVWVAGVHVGGLDPAEAEIRVRNQLSQVTSQELTLEFEGQYVRLPIAELDPKWDVTSAIAHAYQLGRSGNLWRDSLAWVRARFGQERVPVPVTFLTSPVEQAVGQLAHTAASPPVDARFALGTNGVEIVPEQPGRGIDLGMALSAVENRLSQGSAGRIVLPSVELPAQVRAEDLRPLLGEVQQLVREPVTLELDGEPRWMIHSSDLLTFLVVERTRSGPRIVVDPERVEAYLAQISGLVVVPPQNAQLRWVDGKFEVVPAQPGAVLDVKRTVEEFTTRLMRGERAIPVQAKPALPEVTDQVAREAQPRAQALVDHGFLIRWSDGELKVQGADLATLLTFDPVRKGGRVTHLAITANSEAVQRLLESLAPRVQVEAKDAVLRYLAGHVKVLQPEQVGRELDFAQSAAAIESALRAGRSEAFLVTREVQPHITQTLASQIQIRERISSGATYYGDSAPNRRHNVELAVERVNGALLPPGAEFSFNRTVGPINLASGYKVGYGIVATNGRVETVPSVGGGVCQVSTTLFHAAFWGGFPIIERNWHLYWIPLYGQPPSGLIGLDATVDTDYGLDFRFKNTTSDWIAIVAWADGSWVHFEIWGTKPNWRVEVDDPVVTNVVKADPTPEVRESPNLAPGEELVIERARDGFTVTIRRRVYAGDQLIDDLTLRSTYQPSRNVTMVGPQLTPTPSETPDAGTGDHSTPGLLTPTPSAPAEGEQPVPTP